MNISILKKLLSLVLLISFSGFLSAQSFTDVTIDAGITDPDNTKLTHDGASATDIMGLGSGAAWIDYNQDGNLDLYVTMRTGANILYHNNGDGTFTDKAAALGVEDASGDGAGVVVGDINNDGWPDLFLNNCNEDKLFRNNNGSSFTDITVSSGLDGILGNRRGTSATFGDYDSDGYIDLFVSHHVMTDGTFASSNIQDFLIHNDGDETFTDVSSLMDSEDLEGTGFIGGWTDFDDDGDLDIILVNDCEILSQFSTPTKVFRNDGGTNPITNWTFTEVGVAVGINDCRNGMGIAVGDYDRDGKMDVLYSNIGHIVLFDNNGGNFTDVTNGSGLNIQNELDYSWGCTFVDYDLDGWQDVFVALGELHPTDLDDRPNQMFKNDTDGTFTSVGATLGLDDSQKSRNGIFGDYDNDGDLDLFVVNYAGEFSLHRNDVPDGSNKYLIVKPSGTDESNADGIGAKVTIVYGTPEVRQVFEVRSGSNLGGGEEIGAFFGVGTETVIDSVIVDFLSGEREVITNVSSDQKIVVKEPELGLPVEMLYFEAIKANADVRLEWATASEINNEVFLVEHSTDGRTFEMIGEVAGNGTINTISNYLFTDKEPVAGDNYYRLRQIDFDGSESLSEIKSVRFEGDATSVKVIPNPVNKNSFNLSYTGTETTLDFVLYDVFGKQVHSGIIQNGNNQEVAIDDLPNGLYILRLSGKLIQHTEKVMISK